MPNHVHLVLAPSRADGLAAAMGRTHRRYAGYVNARARRTGHVFQERFSSAPMDEAHVMAAFGYISLNPVRARLVARAQDWPWSSVGTHLGLGEDGLTDPGPAAARIENFADLLTGPAVTPAFAALRQAEAIGRPLGSADFITTLETRLNRRLTPAKRGPKPKNIGK